MIPFLCMQRKLNASIALTCMRWDQNVQRHLWSFFPTVWPLTCWPVVPCQLCSHSVLFCPWCTMPSPRALCVCNKSSQNCAAQKFLIVTNAFKLLLKLPHVVRTSNIKYILVIRELSSLTLSMKFEINMLTKFFESTYHLLDTVKCEVWLV